MRKPNRDVCVRVDAYTRVCLTVIAVLLTVLIVGLWAERGPAGSRAVAGKKGFVESLDAAAQRKAIVAEQQKTNAKLDELIALFRSGKARVKVEKAEAKAAGGAHVPSSPPKKEP